MGAADTIATQEAANAGAKLRYSEATVSTAAAILTQKASVLMTEAFSLSNLPGRAAGTRGGKADQLDAATAGRSSQFALEKRFNRGPF